ncbi:hypothetical protein RSAG8_06017, partial [Rhizoctonia solani AG-8 WAC10335]
MFGGTRTAAQASDHQFPFVAKYTKLCREASRGCVIWDQSHHSKPTFVKTSFEVPHTIFIRGW